MSDKKKDIISKDSGLDPIVYDILNEAYHEFRQMYGDKHSDHIKKNNRKYNRQSGKKHVILFCTYCYCTCSKGSEIY